MGIIDKLPADDMPQSPAVKAAEIYLSNIWPGRILLGQQVFYGEFDDQLGLIEMTRAGLLRYTERGRAAPFLATATGHAISEVDSLPAQVVWDTTQHPAGPEEAVNIPAGVIPVEISLDGRPFYVGSLIKFYQAPSPGF